MNNKVIFAAAGNGKTHNICKEAIELASKTKKSILLVTYTNEGASSLEKECRNQSYGGVINRNIEIKTWYNFLLNDLIKPYQTLLKLSYKYLKKELNISLPENFINGVLFTEKGGKLPSWFKKCHFQYYFNGSRKDFLSARDIIKDKASELACKCIEDSENRVISRLEKIYSHAFFDELQDFAGWDLDIIEHLFHSNVKIKCVGDPKQATFRTNSSNKNSKFRDSKIENYFIKQEKNDLCKISYENSTRRFNQEICDFVNAIYSEEKSRVYPLAENNDCENSGMFIIDNQYVEKYCNYCNPTILRYNKNVKSKFNHNCLIFNYGNSKGNTFDRVVIIPTKDIVSFLSQQNEPLKSQTRAKFYIACTRAKHSVVFALDDPRENDFFKPHKMKFGDISIPAYKYTNKR